VFGARSARPMLPDAASGGKDASLWLVRLALAVLIAVACLGLRDLRAERTSAGINPAVVSPVLPPAVDRRAPLKVDPRTYVRTDDAQLRRPMRFSLERDGVLVAEGAIDADALRKLTAELDVEGRTIRVVSLNSPGGEVQQAMAMARLVRERGIATEVEDGALCASSCPILFAGGVSRIAAPRAAIGLHQFFAATAQDAEKSTSAQALSDAQLTTARITRFLAEMGVDPALWLHAMDTPPQALYYLSRSELARYRLVDRPLRQSNFARSYSG